MTDSVIVDAPLAQTWQTAKAVLREMNLDLYTRDKRGLLVAYSQMKRRRLVPQRTEFTISMVKHGEAATAITVETVKQVYGVTLLTYPGWHDRKTTDNAQALAILGTIQTKISAPSDTVSEEENLSQG